MNVCVELVVTVVCLGYTVMLVVVDGGEPPLPPLEHATSRRFSEKSPAEKEELYERIASQLMSIGDTYIISSPPYDSESTGEQTDTKLKITVYYYYTRLMAFFSRTTWVSQYQKGKTSLGLNDARDDGVLGCSGISWTIYKQSAPHSRQITTPTPPSLNF